MYNNKYNKNKTLIKNCIKNKLICKIYNNEFYNNYFNLLKPDECIDNYNTIKLNKLLNNKDNEKVIEYNNDLSLYFYNTTYISIFGSNINIFINNNKYIKY